jgi:hypothetical protein
MRQKGPLASILVLSLRCVTTAAEENCSNVAVPDWPARLFGSKEAACLWGRLVAPNFADWEKEFPQLETPEERVWFVIGGVDLPTSRTLVFAMAKKVTGEVVVAYRSIKPSLSEIIMTAEEKGEALTNVTAQRGGLVLRSSGGPFGDGKLRKLARKLEKVAYRLWGPKNGWDDPIYGEFRPFYFLYFFGFFSEERAPRPLWIIQGEQPELEKWIEEVIVRKDKWERNFLTKVLQPAGKKP